MDTYPQFAAARPHDVLEVDAFSLDAQGRKYPVDDPRHPGKKMVARSRLRLRVLEIARAFLLAALTVQLLGGAMPLAAEEPAASVEVLAGAAAVLSDDSEVVPVATVTVDAPVWVGRAPVARLRAALRLHGSPGQVLDLSRVDTFQGAELEAALQRRIGAGGSSGTYVVLGGGFASRRDARGEGPRQRFPIWHYAGLGVEHRDAQALVSRRLVVAIGSSQVCHPESLVPRDLVVQGHVRLARVSGAAIALQGDAQRPLWGSGRGVLRMAVLVGWSG